MKKGLKRKNDSEHKKGKGQIMGRNVQMGKEGEGAAEKSFGVEITN